VIAFVIFHKLSAPGLQPVQKHDMKPMFSKAKEMGLEYSAACVPIISYCSGMALVS
jgi:hypothetical protein|tara:strand:- start:552 stop:719 length:168 start_codon:yes stop_codon:yes gene_type:complete